MFQLNLNAMDGTDGELISVDLIDDKLLIMIKRTTNDYFCVLRQLNLRSKIKYER